MISQKLPFLKLNLHTVKWLPCSRRAKHFIPIDSTSETTKSKKNSLSKFYHSSITAYADDATLISDCVETHTKVLQQLNQKAVTLGLCFKPSKGASSFV